MPINREPGTPPPAPMIGKIGPYTVFVTPPATPKPTDYLDSPMKKLSPIETRVQSSPPQSPHFQLPVQSPALPPILAPPVHYKKSAPGSDNDSNFGFFWNAVAKVQNAHASLDDYVAHWFGLNQSKYQWALDDYYESKGVNQDAKSKDISTKAQCV